MGVICEIRERKSCYSPIQSRERTSGVEFFKTTIKAGDYPTSNVRAIPLSKGDTLYIMSEISVRLGDYYKDTNGVITQILYEPKKWWKFWIKKKQIGYMVQWQ